MYCIYRITNNINGKTYIGQHKYIDESNPMGKYKGSGLNLHRAYKKYGEDNFTTEILYSRIRDKATVNAMEIYAIEKYRPEYNIAKGGQGGDLGPEVRTRISKALKGKKLSEETRRKISETNKGHSISEETRRKISKANKGKTPWKGKHHSEETKEKNRLAHIGKKRGPLSEEWKQNISEAKKGKNFTCNAAYKEYKLNNGTMKWNEFQKFYRETR